MLYLHLKNRKNKLWTRYCMCRSKSNYDFDRYCQARSLTRSLRSDYERNLLLNVKQNPKAFWKYINSRLKICPTINDLQCSDGSTAHTDQDKVDVLNKYFTSVFTQENLPTIPSFTLGTSVPLLETVTITPYNYSL